MKQRQQFHAKESLRPIPGLPEAFQKGNITKSIYYKKACLRDYSDDYFLSEYKEQYGQTYLEDERQIRSLSQKRLARIRKLVPPSAAFFEIGCATGFLLDEARQLGYQVQGCEVSAFASSYAQKHFGLDIFVGSFLDFSKKSFNTFDAFDVIVACYVIEHIPEQVWLFKKISQMLTKNGLLYFALPSSKGPAFEFAPQRWAKSHPQDHFIDYDPTSLKESLALYGLRLKKIWPASFHQERCRGWKALLPTRLYRGYARLFCYADTIEGIAQKI